MTLEEQVILLIAENKQLRETINKLENRIADLEEQLRKAKLSKSSSNSSKPPSTDMSRPQRNQSLRESSGRKPGGQPGHEGTTLQMTDTPDEIIELNPEFCNKCGYSLENEKSQIEYIRQEIDIPPIQTITKEYRLNSKNCPQCGHHQGSEFPEHITNNIQYGSNVASLVSYLSVYQYLPFKRLKGLLSHIFNMSISEGTVDNILKRMSVKSESVYNKIKETIPASEQAGSDETSAKVNGKKNWIWVWQTKYSTFLSASESRGSKTIDRLFPDGFPNTILNSDRWAAQLKTTAKGHQLCTAHLLRELKYLQELEENQWAYAMEEILRISLRLKDKQSEYSRSDKKMTELEVDLNDLLKENIPKSAFPKTFTLQKSLMKERDSILTFLYNKATPPDNNASERAIRNAKVKMKVSGQFKSNENVFCILRSVIDTCLKRGVDIMFALKSIAQLVPAE